MPNYRLIFTDEPEGSVGQSVTFTANDASEALLLAQRHASPAELWMEDKRLCILSRSGGNGEFWIIS